MRFIGLLLLALSVFAADPVAIAKLNTPQTFSYAGSTLSFTFAAAESRGYVVVLSCQSCTAAGSVYFNVLDGNGNVASGSCSGYNDSSIYNESCKAGETIFADVRGNALPGYQQTYRIDVASSYSSSTIANGTVAVYEAWDTPGVYDDDRAVWESGLMSAAIDNRTDVLNTAQQYKTYRVYGNSGQSFSASVSAQATATKARLTLWTADQTTLIRKNSVKSVDIGSGTGNTTSATLSYTFPASAWYYVRLSFSTGDTTTSAYTITTNTPPVGGGDYSRVDQSSPYVGEGTGSLSLSLPLLSVHGAMEVPFVLSYDSQLAQATPVGALGRGWSHPFMARLVDRGNGTALVQWDPARRNAFSDRGTGSYRSSEPSVRRDVLTKSGTVWTLTRGDQTSYVFDSAGSAALPASLVSIRNGRGQSLTLAKDATTGAPTKVTDDASGRYISLIYNGAGKVSQVKDPLNRTVSFSYSSSGDDLATVTDARNNAVTFSVDGGGRLTGSSDAIGTRFSASYGTDGKLAWVQDAKGKKTSYAYQDTTMKDPLGSGADVPITVVGITDRLNNVRTVTRDKWWRLLSYKDQVSTVVRTLAYGADGYLRKSTDVWGVVTDYTVDQAGNVLRAMETATDGGTRAWSATYDGANNRLTYTNRDGRTWTWTYEGNKVKTAKDPLGNTTVNTYDGAGLLASTKRPGGGVVSYVYQYGQPVSVTDAAGDVTGAEFDLAGRKTAFVDARAKRWGYAYDLNDNPVTDTDPLGKTTQRVFDVRNRPTQVTDRRGKVSKTEYDANGNVSATVSPSTLRTENGYDDEDRPLTVKRPGGGTSSWVRDARGLVTETHDELGNVSKTSYNAAGLPFQRWDAKNVRVQLLHYDLRGRVDKSTDALLRETLTEFDVEDRPVATVDNKGRRTELRLDLLGRTSSVMDADGGAASQGFTADGDLADFTDPNGHKTVLSRDLAGRIASEVTAAGGPGTAYAYRGGLITRVTNARAQAADRAYDGAGRSTGFTDPEGTVALTLDEEGHPLTTSEGGRQVVRTFDDDGRLVSAASPEGTIGYGYSPADGLLKTLSFDGVSVTFARDADGLVKSVTDWASRTWTIGRDANRRVTSVAHPNGVTEARTYDDAGTLASITVTGPGSAAVWSCSFAKDAVGKTASETPVPAQLPPAGSKTSAMTYVADNRLATFDGWPVTHDLDGNLTSCPRAGGKPEALAADARNRVTSFGGVTYTYGAENERIGVTSGGAAIRYLVNLDVDLSQVLVADAGSAGKTRYVHVPGVGLLAEDGPAGLRCYHADARGSTVALTGPAGAVLARFAYGPYGEDWGRPDGAASTPFRFGGRDGAMTDANGLIYLRARYYSPVLRRFVARDPVRGGIDDPRAMSAYAYANGDPVDMTDPLGTSAIAGATSLFDDVGVDWGKVANLVFSGVSYAAAVARSAIASVTSELTVAGSAVVAGQVVIYSSVATTTLLAFPNEAGDPVYKGKSVDEGDVSGRANVVAKSGSATNAMNANPTPPRCNNLSDVASYLSNLGDGKAMAGNGTSKPIDDINRIVSTYGGSPSDWAKMTSRSFAQCEVNGKMSNIQAHWYENIKTGQRVEVKPKVQVSNSSK